MTDTLKINLYDDILPEVARDIAAQLAANPAADVVLRINSPGGSVTDGYALASALRSHAGHKTAVVEGLCASAATFPACACDEIHMHAESLFMVHGPWGEVSGGPEEMGAQAGLLDKMADLCAAMYQRKSGAKEAQVREWMSRDTWMTPAEAMAAGFCDKILDAAPPPMARAAAQSYLAQLRPAPKNTIKENKMAKTDFPKLPENLAAKLAKHGMDDDSPEKMKAAYQAYLAATEDGPGDRTEMAKAMASVEKVDGPGGDNGERADNPVTLMKDGDEEESSADKSEKMKAKLSDLDPAVAKLVGQLTASQSATAKEVKELREERAAREVADYHAYAKARVSKADADEYLALAKNNVQLARTLVGKFPEKTMTKLTHDGRPTNAAHARASESEAAPMVRAGSGTAILHGHALSAAARASLPTDKPPTFAEVAKAQRAIAKNRPDLWA